MVLCGVVVLRVVFGHVGVPCCLFIPVRMFFVPEADDVPDREEVEECKALNAGRNVAQSVRSNGRLEYRGLQQV